MIWKVIIKCNCTLRQKTLVVQTSNRKSLSKLNILHSRGVSSPFLSILSVNQNHKELYYDAFLLELKVYAFSFNRFVDLEASEPREKRDNMTLLYMFLCDSYRDIFKAVTAAVKGRVHTFSNLS